MKKSNILDKINIKIQKSIENFRPKWADLASDRVNLAYMVVVYVEEVGGRGKAAKLMNCSPSSIDNYRSGLTIPDAVEYSKLEREAKVKELSRIQEVMEPLEKEKQAAGEKLLKFQEKSDAQQYVKDGFRSFYLYLDPLGDPFYDNEILYTALWSTLQPFIEADGVSIPENREVISKLLIKELSAKSAAKERVTYDVVDNKVNASEEEKPESAKPAPSIKSTTDSQIIIHEHDKAVEVTEIIDTKPAKKKRKKLHGLAEIPEGFMAPAIISQLPPVPILGCAAGSAVGSMAISPDALDQADRPIGLKDEEDAYALFVQGESMAPRYVTGDLVYVSPDRAFKQDDYVIIQTQYYDGAEILSYVKQFIRHTDDSIVTRQFNPAGEIEFKNQIVIAVHRVMQLNELQGKGLLE